MARKAKKPTKGELRQKQIMERLKQLAAFQVTLDHIYQVMRDIQSRLDAPPAERHTDFVYKTAYERVKTELDLHKAALDRAKVTLDRNNEWTRMTPESAELSATGAEHDYGQPKVAE